MEQAQVDALLQEVITQARTLNIPVSAHIQPQVKINHRAVGRFGCCRHIGRACIIELSARLLQAEEWAVRETLAHEILHTCPGCANHGTAWKNWAGRMNAAFGYRISRTDAPERLGLPPGGEPRYLLVCTQCRTEFGRSRRSALVEHPGRYRCRCGGKLKRQR